jgi:Fe2+ transport protein
VITTKHVCCAVAGATVALACAGCGGSASAIGNTTLGPYPTGAAVPASGGTTSAMSGMSGTAGMSMNAMPIVQLGQATWQGMRIIARSMAPAPFVVVTGTSERMVRPTKADSIHLMVMLTDAHTGVPIPYATVWATIRRDGHIVYDQRQWPMLSRYMGVHYGNNVALPGAGSYQLTLLVGPPQSARHLEYAHVWLHPHRVQMTFHWKPGA